MDTSTFCRLGRMVLLVQRLSKERTTLHSPEELKEALYAHLRSNGVPEDANGRPIFPPPPNKIMNAEEALAALENINKAFPNAGIKEIALLVMRQELVIQEALNYLEIWNSQHQVGSVAVEKALKVLVTRKHEGEFNPEEKVVDKS
jgi:hypothetical protein